jgi:membrane protein
VFGVYTTYAGSFQLYGVLGGVLLLLVWFYFAGLLLLVGVAVNVVAAGRIDDLQRVPAIEPVQDRQLQQGALRESDQRGTMSDTEGPTDDESAPGESAGGDSETSGSPGSAEPDRDPTRRADVVTQDDLDDLRQEIDNFEAEIEGRTVHREELEGELKGYVRSRVRRGHARGWGPYLVLLYGTVMTLGAFASLSGIWAILAMLVIWLSTLGLYTLMVLFGLASTALGLPGRVIDRLRNLR